MQTFTADTAAELAVIRRNDFIESRHLGVAVVLAPDGEVAASLGDVEAPIYPRSAFKPLQTIASMNAGAELAGAQIALASGSHTGSFEHMKVAQSILEEAGLTAEALQCPPAWPQHEASFHALIKAGHTKQRLAFNCSGKHAAFLWACVKSGWSVEDYLSLENPLQKLVMETIEEFCQEPPLAAGTDGCGAPLAAVSTLGLARAYSTLGAGIENIRADARVATVATAMVDYPEYVTGEGKTATVLSEHLQAVVKHGAEGVLAIGLPSGASAVVKVLDGASRPTALVAVRLLEAAGYISSETAEKALAATMRPIFGGSTPVGAIDPGVDLAALLEGAGA